MSAGFDLQTTAQLVERVSLQPVVDCKPARGRHGNYRWATQLGNLKEEGVRVVFGDKRVACSVKSRGQLSLYTRGKLVGLLKLVFSFAGKLEYQ